jgi:hypothetical protein
MSKPFLGVECAERLANRERACSTETPALSSRYAAGHPFSGVIARNGGWMQRTRQEGTAP